MTNENRFSDWEDSDATNDDLAFYVPPVHSKTWVHTGAWRRQADLEAAYAAEYFSGDPSAA